MIIKKYLNALDRRIQARSTHMEWSLTATIEDINLSPMLQENRYQILPTFRDCQVKWRLVLLISTI